MRINCSDEVVHTAISDGTRKTAINPTGRLFAVYSPHRIVIKNRDDSELTVEEDGSEIVWVGWCPQSHLGNHFTLLTSNGRLSLYQVDLKSHTASLQCSTIVRSSEDWTLQCISASFGPTSLFVLLENGDVVKVGPWLPLPCVLPKDLTDNAGDFIYLGPDHIFVSSLNDPQVKISAPCLIQPEPIEPLGEFKWILAHEYNGLTFLLIGCGSSRIDVLLDLTEHADSDSNPMLVLLESIEISSSKGSIHCRPYELDPNQAPIFLVSNPSGCYLLEFTWAAQLVDSILYNVTMIKLKSSITQISSEDATIGLPYVAPDSGHLKAVLFGKEVPLDLDISLKMNKISQKTLSAGLNTFSSPIPKHLDIKPAESNEYSHGLRVSCDPIECPETLRGLCLPELTEDALITLLEKVVDPLRSTSMAELVAASNTLTILSRQIDDSIQFQVKWLESLIERINSHTTALQVTAEGLSCAIEKQRALEKRLQAALFRLKMPQQTAFPEATELALRATELSSTLQRITNRELEHRTDSPGPDPDALADLCRLVSKLTPT